MAEEKPKTDQVGSLETLARNRAKLYENIGKIKGQLASFVVEHCGDLTAQDEGEVEAPSCEMGMVASLREERDALRRAVRATEDALEVSEDARVAFLEEKVRLRAEIEQLSLERDEALRKVAARDQKLERVRRKTEAAFVEQEELRQGLESKVATLSEELARSKARLSNRELDIRRLENELGWLKSDVLSMAGDAAKSVEELQKATVERDAHIWSLEERLEDSAVLDRRLQTALEEKEKLDERVRGLLEQRELNEQRIEEMAGQLQSEEFLAKELGEARGDITALQGELEGLRARVDSLQRERDKLAMLRVAGQKRLESIEAENVGLREELDKTAANLNEVKRLIKAIEEAGL